MIRALHWLMASLFAFAAVVQYNDPDPLRWIVMYGSACGVCVMAGVFDQAPRRAAAIVWIVAVAWGVVTAFQVPQLSAYGQMFGTWHMDSVAIEHAREASGLFIVAGWMSVIAGRGLTLSHLWSVRRGPSLGARCPDLIPADLSRR